MVQTGSINCKPLNKLLHLRLEKDFERHFMTSGQVLEGLEERCGDREMEEQQL